MKQAFEMETSTVVSPLQPPLLVRIQWNAGVFEKDPTYPSGYRKIDRMEGIAGKKVLLLKGQPHNSYWVWDTVLEDGKYVFLMTAMPVEHMIHMGMMALC